MNSVAAKRTFTEILDNIPTHRRRVIEEETTLSDMSERVHHMKIVVKFQPSTEEAEVWPIRNRILDMHRNQILGSPEDLKHKLNNIPRSVRMWSDWAGFWDGSEE